MLDAALEFVTQASFTDVLLTHSPSQIAAAALSECSNQLQLGAFDKYFREQHGEHPNFDTLKKIMKEIVLAVEESRRVELQENEVADLRHRRERAQNPVYDPTSEMYVVHVSSYARASH